MLCPVPLPIMERTPQLTSFLTEEPHVVPPKDSKPPRAKAGLRGRETSITPSEETHASSTHEDDIEEDTREGILSLKGKREASEGAEEEA